jgi:hypothetical protein
VNNFCSVIKHFLAQNKQVLSMRILIFSVLLLSLSSCLATPRFFPHTYEGDEDAQVVAKPQLKKRPINQNGIQDF